MVTPWVVDPSEVEETSTGLSRPLASVSIQPSLTGVGSGVDVTDEAEVSTNFSENKNYYFINEIFKENQNSIND